MLPSFSPYQAMLWRPYLQLLRHGAIPKLNPFGPMLLEYSVQLQVWLLRHFGLFQLTPSQAT